MTERNHAAIPLYPVANYQTALETAAAVSDTGGINVEIPKSVIASQLKVSDSSGAFIQRISTTRSYGMIYGRGAYKLTPEAQRYFFPASEEEKKRAELSFFASPPLFAEIIKRFDGNKVPPIEMLANILHREFKVGESWKERVAGFFVKTANLLGLIDSAGFLRYHSTMQSCGNSTQMEPTVGALPLSTPPTVRTAPSQSLPPIAGMNSAVFYDEEEGKSVRIEASPKLSAGLWTQLNAYVKVLKPKEINDNEEGK